MGLNEARSANLATTGTGRQYHIELAPGEVAQDILLVGDPARVNLAAELFGSIELRRENREYASITGRRGTKRTTVLSTGIGPGNMEIAVIELAQCVDRPTMIRSGSCGAIQPDIGVGDFVISQAAYRLENTSLHFIGEGYPAVTSPEVFFALVQAAEGTGVRYHTGITATASGFYGAQGRPIPGFPPRGDGVIDDLQRQGVKNLEMEISTLFSLATLGGFRAGAVCAVFGSRHSNAVVRPEEKHLLERRCVEIGLNAFDALAKLDRARGNRPCWHPGLQAEPAMRPRSRPRITRLRSSAH